MQWVSCLTNGNGTGEKTHFIFGHKCHFEGMGPRVIVVAGKDRADNDSRWALTGMDIERTRRILARVRTRSIRGTGCTRGSLGPRSRG